MILKKNSTSFVKCWSEQTIRSDSWSFDPDWAYALWVSWNWNSTISSSYFKKDHVHVFSMGKRESSSWFGRI